MNAPFGPSTGLSSSGGASGGSETGPASAGGSEGGATGAGAAGKRGASTCHGCSPPSVGAGATVELNERKMEGVVESPSDRCCVRWGPPAGGARWQPQGRRRGGDARGAKGTHSPQVGGFTEGFAVDECGEEDEEDEGAHGQVEGRGARDASRLPRRLARERFHRGRWSDASWSSTRCRGQIFD